MSTGDSSQTNVSATDTVTDLDSVKETIGTAGIPEYISECKEDEENSTNLKKHLKKTWSTLVIVFFLLTFVCLSLINILVIVQVVLFAPNWYLGLIICPAMLVVLSLLNIG